MAGMGSIESSGAPNDRAAWINFTSFSKKLLSLPALSLFQWEVGISKVEEFQRPKAPVERQNPAQQRHLAGLVHAV